MADIPTVAKAHAKTLRHVVEATRKGDVEFVENHKAAKKLLDDGFAVVQGDSDIHGNLPMMATQLGYDWYDANVSGSANQAPAAQKPVEQKPKEVKPMEQIAVETGALPARARKRRRSSKFPFEELAAPVKGEDGNWQYSYFFVPATEENEDPAKSLSSRCSVENRNYGEQIGEETYKTAKGEEKTRPVYRYDRKFMCIRTEQNGQKGAAVYRVDNTLEGGDEAEDGEAQAA